MAVRSLDPLSPHGDIQSARQPIKSSAVGHHRVPSAQRTTASSVSARAKQDRYLQLVKNAELRGDQVEAENCYQHADHFYRVMLGQE
jgi:hypothetical protein